MSDRPSSSRRWGASLAIGTALVLTACTAPPAPAASPSVTESNLGTLGGQDCDPPSPTLGQVIQGTGSTSVTAYGLLFGPDADAIVGDGSTTKMAVRMTGSGTLHVHVLAPDGSQRPLAWGPDPHGGSTFHRPGSEWGIGFSFDAPGCWQIAFERDGGDRADFWFDVGP